MDVVRATIEDLDSISRLWKELDESQIEIAPDRIRDYTGVARSEDIISRWITGDDRVLFLAMLKGHAVGFVNLWLEDVEEENMIVGRRFAQLGNIFVTKSSRRQGIAKSLMNRAKEWSKQNEAPKIELQVYSGNAAAIRMYSELGFRPFMQKIELDL